MIYVDNAAIPCKIGKVTSDWSHLTADTVTELREFADKIGLPAELFRNRAGGIWYDVHLTGRRTAVEYGALPVTWQEHMRLGTLVVNDTGTELEWS